VLEQRAAHGNTTKGGDSFSCNTKPEAAVFYAGNNLELKSNNDCNDYLIGIILWLICIENVTAA
jgi:hypothetical protein